MLDDYNVLKQRDSERTLQSTPEQYKQVSMDLEIGAPEHDNRRVRNVVYVGMGGSALAPEFALTWLGCDLKVPFEIIKSYDIPGYVDEDTLVFVASCSGNTEEVIEAYHQARKRNAQVAVIAGGGKLFELADKDSVVHIKLPPIQIQPRMLTFIQVRALVVLLGHFGVLQPEAYLRQLEATSDWLRHVSERWASDVPIEQNYAKQLALLAVGKTPVFYGGYIARSLAYKWKISWNENAKNVAFWNYYPEFNHNEFIGWTSHPIEKPFAVFDLISDHERDRIHKRAEISDRLLSGKRPKATTIQLEGDSLLEQLLAGHVLADFVSIYVGILNNVDPGPVPLITKLKQELAD